VRSLVSGWLGSALSRELAGATNIRAEVPFVLGIGDTVIRGQIDLLARENGVPCVVDYKTDGLHGQAPAALADRYKAQREIYALAVGAESGAKVAHVFLEAPDQPVIQELGPEDLERARARLEGLIAAMRGNQFRPTEDPYEALCFGCPAAARLCPNAKWHPGR
jgi:ATP-dependent helicase/nuclease subunit A